MPTPKIRNRQALRSRFVRQAIPTEADFADLIASSLNLVDDGVLKLPDQPLGLVPPKRSKSVQQKGVLNFFTATDEAEAAWQMQLIGDTHPGFGLADHKGTLALLVDATGNVGIGTATPRVKLDVQGALHCDSISGLANRIHKAHFALKGGGQVTWSKDNRLTWTQRFIATGVGGTEVPNDGFFNIYGPGAESFEGLDCWDGSNRIQNRSVELREWESLYAIWQGKGPNDVRLKIVNHGAKEEINSNWLLIASRNADDSTLKLGIGATVSPGQSISRGSPVPCGTIVMWSGRADAIPDGWFVCDGTNGTPDLRGRFILGSGQGAGLTNRNPQQPTGGRESVSLGMNELPRHHHEIKDDGHSHRWTASRALPIVDDGNFGSEFSRGDSGNSIDFEVNVVNTTGITIREAGNGAAFEIMPPFYILIFIMKGYGN